MPCSPINHSVVINKQNLNKTQQRRREDAPAAPSTTSIAEALCDFFLLSPWPCCTKPGSQPAPGPASPEIRGSFHLCCSFEGIYRLQMCHPGSSPDYINLPALVPPRMTWPLTRLSLLVLISTLGHSPLQGQGWAGGLPCARRGVRVCLWGSCPQDLFLWLPWALQAEGTPQDLPPPVPLCLSGGPHRVAVGSLHFLPSTTDRHLWSPQPQIHPCSHQPMSWDQCRS